MSIPEEYQTQFSKYLDAKKYPSLTKLFLESGRITTYPQDSIIVGQNVPMTDICVMFSGEVEVSYVDQHGILYTMATLGAGSWRGEPEFLEPGSVGVFSKALTEVVELQVSYKTLRQSKVEKAELYEFLARNLGSRIKLAHKLYQQRTIFTLEERILTQLNSLADSSGCVQITQEKLASYMGASRYQIIRSLKKLEAKGLVARKSYGVLELLKEQQQH
ncbi:Crp/Fnr family transcriptional regulator [Photobacterium sp. BZF1]|uniref:Crp/Fnr family transcriptional regulator n=1 Tax=Photobacterium sp. BZF1 TaxID=1904457 RepID=UPI001653941A|nr:Crp/Fnr family transcriptional regulator [Photobacterium sp. BZF1]MBC7006321.1 Crp/Fnr family transcriptional regulator [Photobacterium sp. BZF1]